MNADHEGCATRAEVSWPKAVTAPGRSVGCQLTGASWYSPYDDSYFTTARSLDIDHLVPQAWDSGAFAWTAKEREAYANDLADDRALIAVTARTNRQKADQDPSAWLPPARPAVTTLIGPRYGRRFGRGLAV
ncbi:HNH endonuclease family protein [Streptomyces sp. NPDC005402]|uniref:HNH endonuclease family protein n=1 Tax=Streptomyces sp. NPDC005402 TaxID=3155338 RepID=UPI0033B05331